VYLRGGQLHQTDDFVYLGGTISSDGSSNKDIDRRVGLAAGIVRNPHNVCKTKDISKSVDSRLNTNKTIS